MNNEARWVVFPPDIFRSDVLETPSLTLTLVDTCVTIVTTDLGPPFRSVMSDHDHKH